MEQHPTKKRQKSRLRLKTTLSASVLVLISVLVSLVLYYGVCSELLSSRAGELDRMLMQTAVDRTNRYLGEIAGIINLSVSEKSLETMLQKETLEDTQQYWYIRARNDYEKHLRSVILSYDQVENFIFCDENSYLAVYENSGSYYRAQVRDFYRETLPLMTEKAGRQFFLLNLTGKNSNRIAIISPVFQTGKREPAGILAAILSDQFSSQLQFAGDQIYMVDQLGNTSYLRGGKSPLPELELLERDLIFKDWKLTSVSFREPIVDSFARQFSLFVLLGLCYLIAASFFAYWYAGRLTKPLRDMNRSLKLLANRREAKAHGDYRVAPMKQRMHFKHRLMAFYILLVSLPVVASSVGFYSVTQSIFDQRIGYFSEHRTNFLFDQLNLASRNYQHSVVELAYNLDIQQYMLASGEEAAALESTVSRLLLQKQTQDQGIMNISLLRTDGSLLYSSSNSRHFIDHEKYDQMIRQMEQDSYRSYWSGAYPSAFNKDCITISLTMFALPPNPMPGQRLGYLVLDFNASELETMIADFRSTGNAHVFLFDEAGAPIFPAQQDSTLDGLYAAGTLGTEGVGGKKNVLFEITLAGNQWKAVAEIPREEYLRERNSILVTCIAIITLLLLLCSGFSYFSSMAVSRGLESLRRFLKGVDSVRYPGRFDRPTGDEIEELGTSFNEMLDTLDRLMEEQERAQAELRDSQLAAKQFELNLLQSQINPHFLYNTLKTVQYMVHVSDLRAEKMIKLLIRLFRTGISRNERLVTVEEEIQHVTTYLQIQQIRFSDKFEVRIELPDEAQRLYLLKLTLQPIVENAIYHGLELLDRNGLLSITVDLSHDLVITVSDDGNGMTHQRLLSVREKLEGSEKSDSIGLFNVHQRIRLYFGKPYGITLESAPGAGTRVSLRFPLIHAPEDFPLGVTKP